MIEETTTKLPTTETATETATLEVPGATLTYDVRRSGSSTAPALLLIGSPMGAAGFVTLAGHFGDRTVVTYDPRGVERSRKTDPASPSTPEQHADDLHRVIEAVGEGPVDLFASSGGAVNALALVARHPGDVRTLVAHEPPAAAVLPGSWAGSRGLRRYPRDVPARRHGRRPWPSSSRSSATRVSFPTTMASGRPRIPPCSVCRPTTTVRATTPCSGRTSSRSPTTSPTSTRSARRPTRVVIAAGEELQGELAHRAGVVIAERLGQAPVMFPSGHAGFLGGEYGQHGDPDAFAVKLREVLSGAD